MKKHIRHEQYREALFEKQTFRHGMGILRSERHRIEQGVSLTLRFQALNRKKWGGHAGIWTQGCGPRGTSRGGLKSCSTPKDPIRRYLCAPQAALLEQSLAVGQSQTVFEGIAVLAVKQTDPARLLAHVLQDRVVLLRENPDRLLCMAARESEQRQHIFFLC